MEQECDQFKLKNQELATMRNGSKTKKTTYWLGQEGCKRIESRKFAAFGAGSRILEGWHGD
jgi:hypothetical protein